MTEVSLSWLLTKIEIEPEEFGKLMEERVRNIIIEKFKGYGFSYISMDLMGYRTGSMNETLDL